MTLHNKRILYVIPVVLVVLLSYFFYIKTNRKELVQAIGETPFERGLSFEKAELWDPAVREYEKAFGPGSKTESEEIFDALIQDIYRKAGVKGNDSEKRGLRLEKFGAIILAKKEYERLFQPPLYHYSIDILNRLLRCYESLGEYEKKTTLEGMINKEFSPLKKIDTNFGDRLVLIGYDIDKEEVNPVRKGGVKRGDVVSLTYYWKGLKRMSRDYAIFVHFIKGDRIFFQNDHYPLDKKFMTTRWHEDEVLKEHYRVSIPEDILPGEYEILIGIWDPEKKKRLRIKGKDSGKKDSIVVGTLRVV